MPWQQIKLKPAWKKEALKCCHMQDCMGTSWGTHVVLGLSERCWVCVVYRLRHTTADHSAAITEDSNSWWTIIFCKNVIFKTCHFGASQRLLDTTWHATWDNQLRLNADCQSADIFWTRGPSLLFHPRCFAGNFLNFEVYREILVPQSFQGWINKMGLLASSFPHIQNPKSDISTIKDVSLK